MRQLKSFNSRGQPIKTPEVIALFVRPSRLPSASNKEEIRVLNKDVLGPLYNQPENILLVLL